MKRFLALCVAATLMLNLSWSQVQLENPGFEEWDEVLTGIFEPKEWSSLKTSDDATLNPLAPVVSFKDSLTAHEGKYAVRLENILTFLVANGTVTNGRVHPNLLTSLAYMYTDTVDGRWNTPLTYRPDSITGWFRYEPQPSDTLEVLAVLHRGFGKQPDINFMNSWIGQAHFRSGANTGSQWTRFSTPFIYFSDQTPQYALVILNSGNGFNPVAGSIAWFDDLSMIYNTTRAPVAETAGPAEIIHIPGSQYLLIRGGQPGRFTTASIMDITGRVVWKGSVMADRIDMAPADLIKGIYLVVLSGKNIRLTGKIAVP